MYHGFCVFMFVCMFGASVRTNFLPVNPLLEMQSNWKSHACILGISACVCVCVICVCACVYTYVLSRSLRVFVCECARVCAVVLRSGHSVAGQEGRDNACTYFHICTMQRMSVCYVLTQSEVQ